MFVNQGSQWSINGWKQWVYYSWRRDRSVLFENVTPLLFHLFRSSLSCLFCNTSSIYISTRDEHILHEGEDKLRLKKFNCPDTGQINLYFISIITHKWIPNCMYYFRFVESLGEKSRSYGWLRRWRISDHVLRTSW